MDALDLDCRRGNAGRQGDRDMTDPTEPRRPISENVEGPDDSGEGRSGKCRAGGALSHDPDGSTPKPLILVRRQRPR